VFTLTELGPKEAEMRIIGCDLHARQQVVAMLDTTTGEVVSMTLKHEGNNVREFYSQLPRPVRVGIEATGSMQWFVNLMEELGIEWLAGHPAEIRACVFDASLVPGTCPGRFLDFKGLINKFLESRITGHVR